MAFITSEDLQEMGGSDQKNYEGVLKVELKVLFMPCLNLYSESDNNGKLQG